MTTYDFITANKRNTAILMAVFFALILGLGGFLDRYYDTGGAFIVFAAGYSLISAAVSYYGGDKIALAVSHATPVSEKDNPYLYRMLENLCIATGSPMPKVYVIVDPAINAFAAGRDPKHASIAVTTGAMEKLANEELEGVLAHELSHIRNYDIRLMTVVAVMVGTIVIIGDLVFQSSLFGRRRDRNENGSGALAIIGLIFIIISPIIAQLIKLAVSRRREFLADASGALITRFPEGLARALEKIRTDALPVQRVSSATAHLFFANPLSGRAVAGLFSTHPPVEERVAALRRMAAP